MKSLRISRQLAKETATMEAYECLSEAYFKCALVDTPSISIYYLQKSEKICATLVEKCPDVVRYSNNLRRVRSTIDLVGKIDYSSIEKSLSKKPEGICTIPEEQNSDVDKDSD